MAYSRRKGRVTRMRRPSLGTAARVALRYASSRMRTRTRTKKTTQGAPLTYDNDFKTDYRYRRMPRGKRRRWTRFKRRVNFVTLRSQQGKRRVITTRVYRHETPTNETRPTELMLYTADGDSGAQCDDMRSIIGEHIGLLNWDDLLAPGATLSQKKLQFESAQLELSIRNVGSNKVIAEVYYVRCRTSQPNLQGAYTSTPASLFSLGFEKQRQVTDIETGETVGAGKMLSVAIGTTPFQSPQFCRTFKIISRRKFVVAPGNMISWILKDPRNRTISAQDCAGKMVIRGHTHGYFIQTYGEPGIQDGVAIGALPTDIVITQTRKYCYYAPLSNENMTARIN